MRKQLIAVSLSLCLLMGDVSTEAAAANVPSDWAKTEVQRAINSGFVPESLQFDYQTNVTRAEFVDIALTFVSAQYHYDFHDLIRVLQEYTALPYREHVFSDIDNQLINWAYALGIVSGRGDGTFDSDGSMTRQEATVILLNTYTAYAGPPL